MQVDSVRGAAIFSHSMNVEQLYDEFGNYVGPEQSDSDSDSLELPDLNSGNTEGKDAVQLTQSQPTQQSQKLLQANGATVVANGDASVANEGVNGDAGAIVLAEDKEYFPSAEQVFGPDTEVLIEEEDAQPITEPLIAPIIEVSSGLYEKEHSVPQANYSRAYLTTAILPTPVLLRNIALVGHIHHGKTSFGDMLFNASHQMPWADLDDRERPVRYMDLRQDEQDRHISIKTTAATFLLQNFIDKSFGVTVLDTPGHLNFLDESTAAMSLVDGVVVVVDVAEGIMMGTEVLLKKAATMKLDIVLVISKLDRLCLELRLPPTDAYHKIRHIIESANAILSPFKVQELSPAIGNVVFASANENVCFTLKQFSQLYIRANGGPKRFPLTNVQLARRFWGDVYYDRETRRFSNKNLSGQSRRTFVEFVLEPYYKLHTAVLSQEPKELSEFLRRNTLLENERAELSGESCGSVNRKKLDSDLKALLREVNGSCFDMGSMSGFVDMIVQFVASPEDAGKRKSEVLSKVGVDDFDGVDDPAFKWKTALESCDPSRNAPLAAYVGKLIPNEQGNRFDCLLRVLSGRIQAGTSVQVLGDTYDRLKNAEDQTTAVVSNLFVPCARFKIQVQEASAGQIVLARGIDETVFKSATIVSARDATFSKVESFRSLKDFLLPACMKLAIEPIRPSELPKMVSSLRQCVKSYPGLVTKVEESGEHTVVGSGELYMDFVLRDLREAYTKVDIKVSDPVVPFAETVSDTSALQCYADTPNKKNKFVMVAEPLEETILKALADGTLESSYNSSKVLRDCGWDALAAKSLWTFGPDTSHGPNALLNDVLIQDTRRRAEDVRESIVQGFCWAMREGPLADEPVRNVKIRLLDTTIAEDEVSRSVAQIIPTCRRVAYSSILTGSPRLMEPVYSTEIICPPLAVSAAYMLVGRRRGLVVEESEVAGAALMRLQVHMPVLDSFGFEPDLRSLTHGSAFCVQMFDHWGMVPGDPFDKSVELKPLEPAGRKELARECMVKTRRRKGMGDEVSLTKYFDDPLLIELARDNEELRQLM